MNSNYEPPVSVLVLIFIYVFSGLSSILEIISNKQVDVYALIMLVIGATLAFKVKYSYLALKIYTAVYTAMHIPVFVLAIGNDHSNSHLTFFNYSVETNFWVTYFVMFAYVLFQLYVAFISTRELEIRAALSNQKDTRTIQRNNSLSRTTHRFTSTRNFS